MYIYRDFGLSGDQCYDATYTKPEFRDGGFFSFTMYGSDKYIHSEQCTLNNRVIKYRPDGTFTMHYGGKNCAHHDTPNRLLTPGDNWYLGMRIYRPVDAVINGDYKLPVPTLIKP